jgi:hypothetical protein
MRDFFHRDNIAKPHQHWKAVTFAKMPKARVLHLLAAAKLFSLVERLAGKFGAHHKKPLLQNSAKSNGRDFASPKTCPGLVLGITMALD